MRDVLRYHRHHGEDRAPRQGKGKRNDVRWIFAGPDGEKAIAELEQFKAGCDGREAVEIALDSLVCFLRRVRCSERDVLRVGQCSWALPAPSRRDTHDDMRQAPSIGRNRRRGRAARGMLRPAPALLSTAQWHGSGSKRSPRGGGRRSHGVAVESFIILNSLGQKQPPEAPQFASSASQRELHGVGIVSGRSLACDRLSDRVRAMCRVQGRLAARSLRTRDDPLDDVRHAP